MIFAVISNNNDKTQKISGFSDTLCVCACVRPLIQLIFSISDWIMQTKKKQWIEIVFQMQKEKNKNNIYRSWTRKQ